MKRRLILPILFAVALSGCDNFLFDGIDGLLNLFNKPQTENTQNIDNENNGQNSGNGQAQETTSGETTNGGGNTSGGNTTGGGNTSGGNTSDDSGSTSGGGTTTGGGTETGGGSESGHNQPAQPADVSKWPSEQRKYVTTFLNGKLPYYSAFNDFETGVVEGSQKPYFNPFVKNTNPVTNYEFEFGDLLRKAGWISEGEENDEDGVLQHYYKYDDLHCQFSKYRADDGIYYFDVYAYNDYEAPLALPNSKLSLDVESMGLTNKYSTYSKTINSYTISGTDIMKQSYDIQLKKDTGKLTITGPSKGIAFIISRNADALFVKYGANKNSLQYAFNNGGIFTFATQANYIEVTAESRVVDIETIDVLN